MFCSFLSATVNERGSSVEPAPTPWTLVLPTDGATVEVMDELLVDAAGCRGLLTDGLVVLFTQALELQEVAPEVAL